MRIIFSWVKIVSVWLLLFMLFIVSPLSMPYIAAHSEELESVDMEPVETVCAEPEKMPAGAVQIFVDMNDEEHPEYICWKDRSSGESVLVSTE